MKSSPKMKAICEELAAKHGVDLSQIGAKIELTKPAYTSFAVARMDVDTVIVERFFGDGRLDLGIVFDTTGGRWRVTAFTPGIGKPRQVAARRGESLESVDDGAQEEAAEYAEHVADALRWQGWLRDAARVDD